MKFSNVLHAYYANRFDPQVIRHVTDFIWYSAVRISFALLLVLLCLGAWQLWSTQHTQLAPGDTPIKMPTISRDQLSSTLDAFSLRTVQYETLKKHPASIVDPAR